MLSVTVSIGRYVKIHPHPGGVHPHWANLLLEKHAWLSAGLVWMHVASDSVTKGVYEDSGPDGLESRPTISLFEPWESGSHLFKLVVGRNYTFPKSLVVPCAWTHSPNSLSLRDAVRNVTHDDDGETRDQPNHIDLEAGFRFPNQPVRSLGSTLSDPLTYWWGVTLCPPELNDVSLAESVVIAMRCAAIKEMLLNTEVQKPSLEEILEFNGPRMDCTIEATPHPNTQAYLSTCEGGGVIQEFEEGDADEIRTQRALTKEQLGVEIPLRSAGAYSPPKNPWPREKETETRDTAFAVQKRELHWKRQGQGSSWDQYGDSSSAAPSASTSRQNSWHIPGTKFGK